MIRLSIAQARPPHRRIGRASGAVVAVFLIRERGGAAPVVKRVPLPTEWLPGAASLGRPNCSKRCWRGTLYVIPLAGSFHQERTPL